MFKMFLTNLNGKNFMEQLPAYLKDYSKLYTKNPRKAALQWFKEAKYGLFLHFGLFSLEGQHEWHQYKKKIKVTEYAKLADHFIAENFDAKGIAKFAKNCGMKYVNFTTRHHDSFCLFDSAFTTFKSTNTKCGRDLVKELADACNDEGLGLCLYYSHGRDWRHPHAPNNDNWGGSAQPEFETLDKFRAPANGEKHNLQKYLNFMTNQITELLTNYGPIAAIWLDGIGVPLNGKNGHTKEEFQCQELYDLIHCLQPQVLVSYKQGLLHTEDFYAPEHKSVNVDTAKPMEICTTMTDGGWGYMKSAKGKHKNTDQVWEILTQAQNLRCNLLLNTAPLPNGALDPEDTGPLFKVGQRLLNEGFPGNKATKNSDLINA